MRRRVPLVAAAALIAGLAGCGLKEEQGDLVAGKRAFVQSCGACHTLQRAGTTGVAGPNLDEAFRAARSDGLGESTIEGVVHQQILYPGRSDSTDPRNGRRVPGMPPKIVTGDAARNVAAYVAFVAAKPGEDAGALADIGVRRAEGTARAEDGTLDLPVDPSGNLAYTAANAEAPAGPLTLRSENPTPIPHNIAVDGNGIDERGPVVQDGGVSELQVELDPGEYAFYCSVPGHREGGMEGTLTVQ